MQARSTSDTAPAGSAAAKLSVRDHLFLSVLWFGLNFQYAALPAIVLPTQLLLFFPSSQAGTADQASALSWMGAAGAGVALVVPPVVGAISDRTWRPFGRRRPYIALGALVLLAGALEMARAPDLPTLIVGFLLVQAGSNGATAAYQGLLPDRVPEDQRGAASGYLGLMTILGNVGSLALAGLLFAQVAASGPGRMAIAPGARNYYGLTSVVLLGLVGITLVAVPERLRPPGGQNEPGRARQTFAAMWIEPWRHRNFAWVFLTRGFVMLGVTLFLTYIEYYFADVLHETNFVAATAAVAALALAGAVVSALALGILSDRIRRVPLVAFSTLCMALTAMAFVLFPGVVPLWPLGIVFGLGYGAYTSVDWALSIDALPSLSAAGKDLGLWAAAATLPAILAPLIGGQIIVLAAGFGQTSLGYRAVFALATVFLLLGAAFVRYIQEDRQRLDERRAKETASVPARQPRKPVGRGWRLAGHTHGGEARGFLRFWPIWERVMRVYMRPVPIPGAPHHLFEVRFMRYHARSITLADGTHVEPGDRVAELHLQNADLRDAIAKHGQWRVLLMLRDDLAALAQWSRSPDFPAGVKAVWGLSMLGRAAPRLGFSVRERPHTVHAWFDRFFLLGLLALYNRSGRSRLERGTTYSRYPVEVWMSRGELERRYPPPRA